MAKTSLLEYARRGAELRIRELQAELNEIYRQFPDLRRAAARSTGAGPAGTAPAAPRRARRPMTASQRKAVSARMKKYWASRRKGESQK